MTKPVSPATTEGLYFVAMIGEDGESILRRYHAIQGLDWNRAQELCDEKSRRYKHLSFEVRELGEEV